MRVLLLLCLVAFAGCTLTPTDVKNYNDASFKSPNYVGEINGKTIYHCEVLVKSGDSYQQQHIYFVGDVMTINKPVPKRNDEVSAMIDIPYVPVQAEVTEVTGNNE